MAMSQQKRFELELAEDMEANPDVAKAGPAVLDKMAEYEDSPVRQAQWNQLVKQRDEAQEKLNLMRRRKLLINHRQVELARELDRKRREG